MKTFIVVVAGVVVGAYVSHHAQVYIKEQKEITQLRGDIARIIYRDAYVPSGDFPMGYLFADPGSSGFEANEYLDYLRKARQVARCTALENGYRIQ